VRRYLNAKNTPKTPSQEVFGRLGLYKHAGKDRERFALLLFVFVCFWLQWKPYLGLAYYHDSPNSVVTLGVLTVIVKGRGV